MSKLTTFSPLNKLRPYKDNWRIRVKCLHSWKQKTSFGGESFEMILADEWISFLYIFVQRDFLKGEWGVIENVSLKSAGGQYRTTNHPYKMTIAEDAILLGSDFSDDRIFLTLANYEEIGNGTLKTDFLIDQEKKPLHVDSNYAESSKRLSDPHLF
ncbi:hypothetical protein N665_0410s0002 [Sinapis alba]|nr:hypothetical protein N665_0410s0002 [Sinapis alba]